ncbi:hypothetical protein DNTS_033365 [Danionella cerebrum]|uniref:REC114 meiotic recombination protein n=1 Tax=Danionella cerebrum TaxID=2873325 RepID=A0A553QJQ7_9TELE|nr:hypothetical protein DNTS_033365 [Danionella translucida]
MEGDSTPKHNLKDSTFLDKCVWKLRRYGRHLPGGKAKSKSSGGKGAWKIFTSSESAGQLELNILGTGHLLVSQGQELLEGFSLLGAQSFLKIHHNQDTVLFNITSKGVARLFRLQFDGSSRVEASGFCEKAVEKLRVYVPLQENQSCPESAAPAEPTTSAPQQQQQQQQQAPEDAPQGPAVATGSLSIKQLSQVTLHYERSPEIQFFLGEQELSLPMVYLQSSLPSADLEPLLRLCLMDSGFPAFVEEVENRLKELTQD